MSSHYPPLANGAYRYGDPPQPLPSPVPGPPEPPPPGDPVPGWSGPPVPATPAAVGPRPGSGSALRWALPVAVAAAVAFLALAAVTALVLGSSGDAPTGRSTLSTGTLLPSPGTPFSVPGDLTIETAPGETVTGTMSGCELPASLADLDEGSRLELFSADGRMVSEAFLRYDAGEPGYCRFTFEFPAVPPGVGPYQLRMRGRGSVTYPESELLGGIELALGG